MKTVKELAELNRLAAQVVIGLNIITQLAKSGPYWDYVENGYTDVRCTHCGRVFEEKDGREGYDYAEDECLHGEDCLWRQAVEYLANLDNDGYDWEEEAQGRCG